MAGPIPLAERPQPRRAEPQGCVFDLDDLLSIVELAEHLQSPSWLMLEDDGRPLPLRVSVGNALGDTYAAHILIEPNGDTTVDFTPEDRS